VLASLTEVTKGEHHSIRHGETINADFLTNVLCSAPDKRNLKDKDQMIDELRKFHVFYLFPRRAMEVVANSGHIWTQPQDTFLWNQDSSPDFCLFLLEGKVNVHVATHTVDAKLIEFAAKKNHSPHAIEYAYGPVLKTLSRCNLLGEECTLRRMPLKRTATVLSTTKVLLFRFPPFSGHLSSEQDDEVYIDAQPVFFRNLLMRNPVLRLHSDLVHLDTFFRRYPSYLAIQSAPARTAALRTCTINIQRPGTLILGQGEGCTTAFLILCGTVNCYKMKDPAALQLANFRKGKLPPGEALGQVTRLLQAGEWFGADLRLEQEDSAACANSFVAGQGLELLRISVPDFTKALGVSLHTLITEAQWTNMMKLDRGSKTSISYIVRAFKTLPYFQQLSQRQCRRLAAIATFGSKQRDDLLPKGSVLFLLSGEVRLHDGSANKGALWRSSSSGSMTELRRDALATQCFGSVVETIGAGDVYGELSLTTTESFRNQAQAGAYVGLVQKPVCVLGFEGTEFCETVGIDLAWIKKCPKLTGEQLTQAASIGKKLPDLLRPKSRAEDSPREDAAAAASPPRTARRTGFSTHTGPHGDCTPRTGTNTRTGRGKEAEHVGMDINDAQAYLMKVLDMVPELKKLSGLAMQEMAAAGRLCLCRRDRYELMSQEKQASSMYLVLSGSVSLHTLPDLSCAVSAPSDLGDPNLDNDGKSKKKKGEGLKDKDSDSEAKEECDACEHVEEQEKQKPKPPKKTALQRYQQFKRLNFAHHANKIVSARRLMQKSRFTNDGSPGLVEYDGLERRYGPCTAVAWPGMLIGQCGLFGNHVAYLSTSLSRERTVLAEFPHAKLSDFVRDELRHLLLHGPASVLASYAEEDAPERQQIDIMGLLRSAVGTTRLGEVPNEYLLDMAKHARLMKFSKGECIYGEGEPSFRHYIILSGTVGSYSQSVAQEYTDVNEETGPTFSKTGFGMLREELGPGGAFGLLRPGDMLSETEALTSRHTYVATTDITALSIHRAAFFRILGLFDKVAVRRVVRVLRGLPGFRRWREGQLVAMVRACTRTEFQAGSVIAQQGSPVDGIIMVMDGQCRITRRLAGNSRNWPQDLVSLYTMDEFDNDKAATQKHIQLAIVGPHSLIGGMGVSLAGHPGVHSSSVVCLTDVTVLHAPARQLALLEAKTQKELDTVCGLMTSSRKVRLDGLLADLEMGRGKKDYSAKTQEALIQLLGRNSSELAALGIIMHKNKDVHALLEDLTECLDMPPPARSLMRAVLDTEVQSWKQREANEKAAAQREKQEAEDFEAAVRDAFPPLEPEPPAKTTRRKHKKFSSVAWLSPDGSASKLSKLARELQKEKEDQTKELLKIQRSELTRHSPGPNQPYDRPAPAWLLSRKPRAGEQHLKVVQWGEDFDANHPKVGFKPRKARPAAVPELHLPMVEDRSTMHVAMSAVYSRGVAGPLSSRNQIDEGSIAGGLQHFLAKARERSPDPPDADRSDPETKAGPPPTASARRRGPKPRRLHGYDTARTRKAPKENDPLAGAELAGAGLMAPSSAPSGSKSGALTAREPLQTGPKTEADYLLMSEQLSKAVARPKAMGQVYKLSAPAPGHSTAAHQLANVFGHGSATKVAALKEIQGVTEALAQMDDEIHAAQTMLDSQAADLTRQKKKNPGATVAIPATMGNVSPGSDGSGAVASPSGPIAPPPVSNAAVPDEWRPKVPEVVRKPAVPTVGRKVQPVEGSPRASSPGAESAGGDGAGGRDGGKTDGDGQGSGKGEDDGGADASGGAGSGGGDGEDTAKAKVVTPQSIERRHSDPLSPSPSAHLTAESRSFSVSGLGQVDAAAAKASAAAAAEAADPAAGGAEDGSAVVRVRPVVDATSRGSSGSQPLTTDLDGPGEWPPPARSRGTSRGASRGSRGPRSRGEMMSVGGDFMEDAMSVFSEDPRREVSLRGVGSDVADSGLDGSNLEESGCEGGTPAEDVVDDIVAGKDGGSDSESDLVETVEAEDIAMTSPVADGAENVEEATAEAVEG